MTKAYRDDLGALQSGSIASEMQYDGTSGGRRIVKEVKNSADLDMTFHFYYRGHSEIEERNASDEVIRQYVWSTEYIDALAQIALNDDPADVGEQDCESIYFALHNANFNVLAIVDDLGVLTERYEYTPYGERSVFFSPGTTDSAAHAPTYISRRWLVASVPQPYGRNPLGHQGLMHDQVDSLIYNRARHVHTTLGRFVHRDPLGYVDGLGLSTYLRSNPLYHRDPNGTLTPLQHRRLQTRMKRCGHFLNKCYISRCAAFTYLFGRLLQEHLDSTSAISPIHKYHAAWGKTLDEGLWYFTDHTLTIDRLKSFMPDFIVPSKPFTWKFVRPKYLYKHKITGKVQGYIQFKGDTDTTGRHDHLLLNAWISHHASFYDIAMHWKRLDDTSPTDVYVKKLGAGLGGAHVSMRCGAQEAKLLYERLCDESETRCRKTGVRIKGPIDEKKYAKLLKSASQNPVLMLMCYASR